MASFKDITQLRLKGKYTIKKIADTLSKVACSHLKNNLWLFDYTDEVTDDMNVAFGIDFGEKLMTLKKSKKI